MSEEYDAFGGLNGFDNNTLGMDDNQQGNDAQGAFADVMTEDTYTDTVSEIPEEEMTETVVLDLDGGLTGLGDGLDGQGLSSDASISARDAANMANQEPTGSIESQYQAQSLKDVATMGMGKGLSAAKQSLGAEGGGMELNAALADEEEEEAINAALADEEEEDIIKAGRADPAPINAGFGKPQQAVGGGQQDDVNVEFTNLDNYNITDNSMANDEKQNIDDIFIAGNFRSSVSMGETSATGGTMYNPKEDHANVNVSFALPPLVKKLLMLGTFLLVIYVVLEYGFHVGVANYFSPVDVHQYYSSDASAVGQALNVNFKQETRNYSSSTYEYMYNIDNAGGLKLVNYNGERMYIEVTGMRINYCILGIRPQVTDFDEAVKLLNANGYEEVESYPETEDLGSMGEEHAFYNSQTGEGVIVGKKQNYDSVKTVKYMVNYKNYNKKYKALRGVQ